VRNKPIKNAHNSSSPRSQRAGVPVFSLYGEPEPGSAADVLHIEDIRTRSILYDWHIAPHRHRGLFQLLFMMKGSADVDVDGRRWTVAAPCAVSVPPSVVHAFRFRPHTEGFVLTLSESLHLPGTPHRGLIETLFLTPSVIKFESMPDNAQRIAALLAQVTAESHDEAPGRAAMLQWLVDAILLLIARQQAVTARAAASGQQLRAFNQFRALVERHILEHWTVPRYARALRSTEGKLNRMCQTVAGKSAFEVIQARLVLEARRRLIYIAASVATVSYELGFEDPAYFSRFFKKHAGVTPSAFRRSHQMSRGLGSA
jgi:AraC family transcriptional activator of pobA